MSYLSTPQKANTAYDQKNFAIDSAQRSTGTKISNFRHATLLPRDYDFDRVTCLQAEIPKAYYMLEDDIGFAAVEDPSGGAVVLAVTIAGGRNYTAAQLATALQDALDAASIVGGNSYTYTVTFDANSGKYTIVISTGEFDITPNNVTEDQENLFKYLGFTIDGTPRTSVSSSLTSDNVVDLQRHNVLYIRSNISNNSGDDILAAIYVGSSIDLSMIRWNTPDGRLYSVGLNNNVASCSQFSLTDANNKEINMNGVNWRFTFQAYKSQRIL